MSDYLSDAELAELEAELADLSTGEPKPTKEQSKPAERRKTDGKPKPETEKKPEEPAKPKEVSSVSGATDSPTTPKKSAGGQALKTFVNPELLSEDLSFSEVNLSDAFTTQAPLYANYARKAAQAVYQEDRFKQARDILEAKIDRELRDDAAEKGEKLTEAMISKRIRIDPRYQKAQSRRNEAKMIAELCKSACEAFKQRRDLLIQAGADSREQFKGEMRMKAIEAEGTASKSRVQNLKEMALNRG